MITTIPTEWRKKRSSKDKEDEERCDQAKRKKEKSTNVMEEKEMDDFMFGSGAEEKKKKKEEDAIMSRDNVISGERAANNADDIIQLKGPDHDDEADDDIISTRKRCVRVLNLVNVLFEPAEVIERFAQYQNTSVVDVERWLTRRQSERKGEREEDVNDIWMTLINWRKKTK